MCFSKISDVSYGNFVHRNDNYKFIHITILLFSFTDLLFPNDCHMLSQDKRITNCMWTAHQTLRNIRQEGATLPHRVQEERDPEVAVKQGFISEPSAELHPQSCTLASALESDSVGLEWVPDS